MNYPCFSCPMYGKCGLKSCEKTVRHHTISFSDDKGEKKEKKEVTTLVKTDRG